MNDLTVFSYEGNEVRTITIDGEMWFVGKDVAEVLGYEKPRNAIATHVDEDGAVAKQPPANKEKASL